ncbi:hypothetical protein NKG05_14865 [Oerskovia sp. M15]
MVLQAMENAGIGPDDHVMMVGFSQGGILAGKLAADPDVPFNIEAIVVAGAPIDAMDIPSDVSVVALQHRGPGPPAGRAGTAPPRDNWVTIETDTWDGPSAPPSSPFVDAGRHNSEKYAVTAQHLSDGSLHDGGYVSGTTQSAYQNVSEDQSMFFSDNEATTRTRERIVRFSTRPRAMTGIVALAPMLALAACSGSSSESDTQEIRAAIVADAPGVEEVLVRFRTDVFSNELDLALSMPTASADDDAALSEAIDIALDRAWTTSPSEPSTVNLEVVLAPFDEGDVVGDPRGVTLEGKGIDEALGLENDARESLLSVSSEVLTERYGKRDAS